MTEILIAIAAWCSVPVYTSGYAPRKLSEVQECRERVLDCVLKDYPHLYSSCFSNEKLK